MNQQQMATAMVAGALLLLVAMPVAALTIQAPTSGTIPLESDSGTTVNVVGSSSSSQDIQVGADQFPDADTVKVVTSSGNLTASSTADVAATVQKGDVTGSWTNVTDLDVTSGRLTVNPADKPAFGVEGDTGAINVSDSIAIDDGNVDFVYNGSSGTTTAVIRGLPPNEAFGAVDGSTTLASNTTDLNGRLVLKSMTNSKHAVKLQTTGPPIIESVSPEGDLDKEPQTAEANISDPDFSASESVDVVFTIDGTKEGTNTITSAGTTSVSISQTLSGGSHTLNVSATDSDGNVVTENVTFSGPSTLYLKNVSNTSENITGVDAEVRALDGTVITKTTGSNGKINMTGFPSGEPIVVDVQNVSNYYDRTTVINSIYEQQNVYLLNSSKASQEVRFEADDKTGNFPDGETFVVLERPLNISNETKYATVSGSGTAVAGHTGTLEDGARYRVSVLNTDRDRRELGGYQADATETITLQIGAIKISVPGGEGFRANASLDNSTDVVNFGYIDSADQTDSLDLEIYERGNRSNLVLSKTYSDPKNLSVTQPVSSRPDSWVVEYTLDRNGETTQGSINIGKRQPVNPGISGFWQSLIGVAALVVVAGLFGGVRAKIGAIVVPMFASALWFIGWLPATVGAGAIIVSLMLGIVWMTSSRRGVPG